MEQLQNGWDGYSAPPPNSLSILYSREFLEILSINNLKPSSLTSSVIGGVAFTFLNDKIEVFVEPVCDMVNITKAWDYKGWKWS